MTKSSSASRASTFPRAPLLPNAAIAGTPFSMPTLAPPSLACVPSGPTIASNSSIGHRGRRSGPPRVPSAAPFYLSIRRSASLQKKESSGRAHGFNPKKCAKSSSGPALNDVVGGHVDFLCEQSVSVVESVLAGSVKAYGVSATNRLSLIPDVPTAKEEGVDYV